MKRVLAALVAVIAIGLVPSAASAQGAPTATVDSDHVALGQRVLVRGADWTPRSLVHLKLCGNAAANLSADCDLASGADAGVGDDGSFSMTLNVSRPPSACPCVVWITDASSLGDVRVPLSIVGLPESGTTATPLPDLGHLLQVTSAKVTGSGSWTSWFGTGSTRTLTFTVRNIGQFTLHDPPVSIVYGKGADPTGFVQPPHIGDIAPGETKTVSAPINVSAFSWGRYTIKVDITALGSPIVFRSSVTTYPWGLIVLAILFVQLVLLAIRNLVRRRIHDDEEVEATAGAEVEATEEVAAVADESVDHVEWMPPEHADVAELAATMQDTAGALLAAVHDRADDMRLASAAIDERSADALRRIEQDAAAHRLVLQERHRVARLDIEHAREYALEMLELAEMQGDRLIADAETRARLLVERAREDAAALLLPATPEAYDGIVAAPAAPAHEGGAVLDLNAQDEDRTETPS